MRLSSAPLVSVLLPYRDAESTLKQALDGILAEDRIPLEIIAADDGSTDGGPTLIAREAARDPRIIPIQTRGAGIPSALEGAVEASRAPFLARMDADDISLPDRLPAQLDALRQTPTLGVVGALVQPFPEEAVGEGLARYVAWQNALITPEDHAREIFIEAPLCHPSVMLRRDALRAVGGFRDAPWAEDYDLWLRLHSAGYGLAKVPRVLLRWRHHPTRATFRDTRYALSRFIECRAHYLAPRLRRDPRDLIVWGAGPTGRKLARALAQNGVHPTAFIDVDPRKIGRIARGVPITDDSPLDPRAHIVIVAVGARGARDLIRPLLISRGFVEGQGFLFAS